VETEKTVIRVHCILVYLCGFYYLYREGLDTVLVSHSPDLHNHCLVFVPSLGRVAHVEREERRIITTVVKCARYLGVCRYCSEVWIFILCVVVVSYVGVFGSVCC